MYTLRKISGQGVQMNFYLGKSYTVIDRFVNYEDFKNCFKTWYGREHVADLDPTADNDTKTTYAFISDYEGNMHALWMGQSNYIMTESGQTFSNLTFKD